MHIYIYNLEKWYWWTYLQGKNRDAEVENGVVDTVGGVNGWMNWESSTDIYIRTALCKTDSGKLLYNTGSSAQCSVTTRGMGWGGVKEAQEGGDICIFMADLPCCMVEINTTL